MLGFLGSGHGPNREAAAFIARVLAPSLPEMRFEILGEAEMEKLGMRTLLGVGQGSRRESQLAVIQWKGGEAGGQPIAFVGKGVCFDTGGISIKPAAGMEDMIWDMGGAAAVAGLMHALAGRKAKVNAVGVLGLVENMPDAGAQRQGRGRQKRGNQGASHDALTRSHSRLNPPGAHSAAHRPGSTGQRGWSGCPRRSAGHRPASTSGPAPSA